MNDVNNVAAAKRPRGRPRKYGFDELAPGECLFVPGKVRADIGPSIAGAQRRTGARFFTTQAPGGVRVCRATRPLWYEPSNDSDYRERHAKV